MIERQHRTLKEALTAHCLRRAGNWSKSLPTVLYAMRTAVNSKGVSPSLLTYGEQIAIPSLFVPDETTYDETDVSEFAAELVQEMKLVTEYVIENDPVLAGPADQDTSPADGLPAHVMLKEPGKVGFCQPRYRGPYTVLDRHDTTVTISLDGKITRVNVDRVKPVYHIRPAKPLPGDESEEDEDEYSSELSVASNKSHCDEEPDTDEDHDLQSVESGSCTKPDHRSAQGVVAPRSHTKPDHWSAQGVVAPESRMKTDYLSAQDDESGSDTVDYPLGQLFASQTVGGKRKADVKGVDMDLSSCSKTQPSSLSVPGSSQTKPKKRSSVPVTFHQSPTQSECSSRNESPQRQRLLGVRISKPNPRYSQD